MFKGAVFSFGLKLWVFLRLWTTALDVLLANGDEYIQLPIPPVTHINTQTL
jgi:hypothetical protein